MIGPYLALLVDPISEAAEEAGARFALGDLPDEARAPALRVRLHVRAREWGGASVLAVEAYHLTRADADQLLDAAVAAVRKGVVENLHAATEAEAVPVLAGLRVGELTVRQDLERGCFVVGAKLIFNMEADSAKEADPRP